MAKYIFKRALQDKNVKVLLQFVPNMSARLIGMKIGKMRYVTHRSEQLYKPYLCAFNYFELRDNFRQKENIGDLMSSYAMELGYIDDIQMDELAKYIGLEKVTIS